MRTGEPYAGSSEKWSAGNGSIMRLAPVPPFFTGNPEEAIEMSGESSRTTHGNPICIDACRYLGALIVGAVNGVAKDELLSAMNSPVPGNWERNPPAAEIAAIALGSFKTRNPPAIKGTGYVVDSLEAALWAFYHSKTFKEGCLLAVNLGDDADTTGAVYGQLAGAYYGVRGISESWQGRITHKDLIGEFAAKLHRSSGFPD